MVEPGFSILFGGALIGLSLFIAVFLWFDKKTMTLRLKQRLLAVFLVGLAFRVSKTSLGVFFGNEDFFGSLGLVGVLLMGPAIFLASAPSKSSKQFWPHFLPALVLMFAVRFIDLSHTGLPLFYLFVLTNSHFGIYFFLLCRNLYVSGLYKGEISKRNKYWPVLLSVGLGSLWLLFVFAGISFLFIDQSLLGLTWSIFGILEITIFYILCFYGAKHFKVVLKPKLDYDKMDRLKEIAEKSKRIIETERLYKKEDINLSAVANKVGTSPHVLSGVLNDYLDMSFSDWINHYRVSYSAELLRDKSNDHLKLEAIAFESGFSTASVFYRNFKKVHKLTPAEYRKRFA